MCVTICGRFCTNEGGVVGYDNRIWAKDTANWGVQIAGMIFQTRSGAWLKLRYLTQAFRFANSVAAAVFRMYSYVWSLMG